MKEYYLRLEAFRIKDITDQERLALQAWFNQSVQAQTGSPKHPKQKYKRFNDFFDTQSRIDEVRSSFELGYASQSENHKRKNANEILAKRIAEFKQLKKAGKIIPLKERR